MKSKFIILICVLSLLLSCFTDMPLISAKEDDNVRYPYLESFEGYIVYHTKDSKAVDPTRPKWGNTGFVIRLDYVKEENALIDNKYAIIRFTDEGVSREINETADGNYKLSTYTITEVAIRKALRNSKYGNLEDEFDEHVAKEQANLSKWYLSSLSHD